MSSFQQVVMGGICLVAAFWFGSYINEQPVDPNWADGPLQQLPDGTLAPAQMTQRSTLAQKTKGFLDSIFEQPAAEKTQTLEQLRSRSMASNNTVAGVAQNLNSPDSPFVNGKAEAADALAQTRFAVSTNSDNIAEPTKRFPQPAPPVQRAEAGPRLAIVPDFSSLAQELRQETSPPVAERRNIHETAAHLLPVPGIDEFKHASTAQPSRDWNAVKQQVMSVEDKLAQFRQANPVPAAVPEALPDTRMMASNNTMPNGSFQSERVVRRSVNFDAAAETAVPPRSEMHMPRKDLRAQPLVAQPVFQTITSRATAFCGATFRPA